MEKETTELKQALAITAEYVAVMFNHITDLMVQNQALMELARHREAETPCEALQELLVNKSASAIRQARSFQFVRFSETLAVLKT
jgi:hypothetical protein